MEPTSEVILIGGAIGTTVLVVVSILFAYLTKKVGPNEALIAFGRRGTRIVVGGSTLVNPITEQYRVFSLELMSFEVAPAHELYTTQGIAVEVEAIAQIKVCAGEPASIRMASEQFLSKTKEEREMLIRQLMEGHLRHIVGHLAVEDLVKNTDYVAEKMRASASPELERMGLVIVSFTLKQVRDRNEYIASLGKLHVAELQRTLVAQVEPEKASWQVEREPVSVS